MKLTEQNYFSPEAELMYMGSTQYKNFLSCESKALAMIRGDYVQEQTSALLVGSYVDAHFSRTLDVFKAQHPEIFLKSGGLKAEYEHANYIIQRIERDDAFMAAISGKNQVIMTGEIEGVPFKIKIDSFLLDRTVDLKIMKDFDSVWTPDEGRVPWWKAWGYDIQAAIYQFVRAQNEGGEIKPFGIAGATKEKPEPDLGLFNFPQSILDITLDEIKSNVVYFDGLKKGLYEPQGCGHCDWCRRNKKLSGWEEIK